MADVYLACTRGPGGFQKLLVVKLARFTGDPTFSMMFLDEAKLAAQLSHPNVVQTYEIGEEGSRHYIVMEYLDGANLSRLRQRANKHGGIPLRYSVHFLTQVLEGLEYAHEAIGIDGKVLRVVHRDLSPSNIMVTAQGVVKILDFGIAKAVDTQSFTQTGRYSGKLNYMPPEQLKAERVDGRVDLFALGVILAECALGERLWGNATGPMIASRLVANDIPSLERSAPIDPELRRICERALAPDRDKRYASASEFKADLLQYLQRIGGPVPREELAKFVCDTVADDRARLQTIIDEQLQRISLITFGVDTPPPDLPRVERTPASSRTPLSSRSLPVADTGRFEPTSPDDHVIEDTGQIQVITALRSEQQLPQAPRSSWIGTHTLQLAVTGGAVVVGAVVLALLLRPPRPAPAPVPPVVAQAPTAPAAPVGARLEIVVSPAEAQLVLDGHPLGANPYVGSFPRDLQMHDLIVSAPGYQQQAQRFALDRDLMLQLHLQAAPKPTTPTPTPAPLPPPTPTIAAHEPTHEPAHATQNNKHPTHAIAHAPTPTPVPVAPVQPAVTTPVVETAPAPAPTPTAADDKRAIDSNVFDSKSPKRTLDTNVYDESQKKPNIDRDSPWKH